MAFFNRYGEREQGGDYSDHDNAFRRMLASSRAPREWYDDEDERGFFPDTAGESVEGRGKRVHTFRRLEDGSARFEIIWWNFELKKYVRISVVGSFEEARSEVNYLNGGSSGRSSSDH